MSLGLDSSAVSLDPGARNTIRCQVTVTHSHSEDVSRVHQVLDKSSAFLYCKVVTHPFVISNRVAERAEASTRVCDQVPV